MAKFKEVEQLDKLLRSEVSAIRFSFEVTVEFLY